MRYFCVSIVCFLCTVLAGAQTATVKKNVILRANATTQSKRITTLMPPATLTLVDAKPKNGFFHVTTGTGQTGWAWAKNIDVQQSAGNHNFRATTGNQDLISSLRAARVTAVGKPLVEHGQTVCSAIGDATATQAKNLNKNKNRTDILSDAAYVPIDWVSLRDLPSNQANNLPGAPVVVEGFLVHRVKVENDGSGESTNCHLLGDNEVDWHIYLSNTAGRDDISKAVIIETTPRTRPLHKWRKDDLDNVVNKDVPVRISGWLMYDFEHVDVIGTQRASVWEVHPITKIEIKRNGQWVDLDQ